MWGHVEGEGVGGRPDPPGGRISVADPSLGIDLDFDLVPYWKIDHWSIFK